MLMVISPAKTLDYTTPVVTTKFTEPDFLTDSRMLVDELLKLSPVRVSELMNISDKLAALNVARYAAWCFPFTPENARQSILAFKGDVYTGLSAETMGGKTFDYAQKHLRILSGLYGLLRPLDLIQPYRLEMGTKLANSRGKDLYTFWGAIITKELNMLLSRHNDSVLINLASNEYFKAVMLSILDGEVVTPVFKDKKNGVYKIISFYAKKARGMMVRYIIDNSITNVEDLKGFDCQGYKFNVGLSTKPNEMVFTREEF